MKIVAITKSGIEFLYTAKSAHEVSTRSALLICNALNEHNYDIGPGEKWHVYDIDQYDSAFHFAKRQSFRIYRGILREYSSYLDF